MDNIIYKDVHFIAGENDDFFDVEEDVLYGFFSCRTIKSKNGQPFNISNIYGPFQNYFNARLDRVDIISATFVYHKSDNRPFVLILEKSSKAKNYYSMLTYGGIRWEPLEQLNGISYYIQKQSLLDVLKIAFSRYHRTELWINESKIRDRTFILNPVIYKIILENHYCRNYDRYYIKGNIVHSILNIQIDQEKINVNRDLRFVGHIYFYYVHDEYSTPLMIETVDYQIAGSLPYINYFIPESVGNKWVPVDCGTDLLKPKCKSDIKRILDGVVEMYRNHPVTIDITKPKYNWDIRPVVRFTGIRFSNVCENGDSYICHTYKSKPTKSFFIKNIMFDNEKQEIDIQSREIEFITVYYKVDQPERPLLICFKLHNKTNNSVDRFRWFYIPRFDKNVWLELDFEAHPHNDKMLIEQKINSIYGSKSISNYIMFPLRWFTFFRVLCITITLFLFIQWRRLRLNLFRLYNHIRR